MIELRCKGCNKRLLTYDYPNIRLYRNPVKRCGNCGKQYIDPRCREIAIEGIPSNTFSIVPYIILILFGLFIGYRGIYISDMHQIGVSNEIQWLMPCFLILFGLICAIGGIYEIITILTGAKKKKFDKLIQESQERLKDKDYVALLIELGYDVPEKYRQNE